jgi:hypothetical protein
MANLAKAIKQDLDNAMPAQDALDMWQAGMRTEREHQTALSRFVERKHREEIDALTAQLATANERIAKLQAGVPVDEQSQPNTESEPLDIPADVLKAIGYCWRWAQHYAETIRDEKRYQFTCEHIDKVVRWEEQMLRQRQETDAQAEQGK